MAFMHEIESIRAMVLAGLDNEEIAAELRGDGDFFEQDRAQDCIDAMVADDDYEMRYGSNDDGMSYIEARNIDLYQGRNAAGEW